MRLAGSVLLVVAALVGMALTAYAPSPAAGLGEPTITVGIDVDTTGNEARSIGAMNACKQVPATAGTKFTVDVVLDALPADQNLSGFNYFFGFDDARFRVAAQEHKLLLTSAGQNQLLDLSEPTPHDEAPHKVAMADVATAEKGPVSGVLGRYTLEVKSGAPAGAATFSLTEIGIFDSAGKEIPIDRTVDGLVAVGAACPASVPTPRAVNVTPTPTTASPEPGQTVQPGDTPTGSATPGATGTPGPTSTPGATATATETAPNGDNGSGDGGDGGSLGYVIGGIVAAAAVLAAGGGFWWWRRRRGVGA
jgi:hypothetical protein